eukprot:TRINITY_DN17156_c0_g3_i1.p1 TRINITY_DN17156_c0_g3~~TRINITY_DN17156_c0_g3_i1.p1  ORF type:complete len:291 (-),score=49.99 TRINITY_DN17156_c0_g3_i1:332-1204(-)
MPVSSDGVLSPLAHLYEPPRESKISSERAGGRAHSENDAETAKLRQAHPHTHSIVLDPMYGRLAFAPDLGMDIIRQFVYTDDRRLHAVGSVPAGLKHSGPLGPRYIEFHLHDHRTAYVVNELASSISVFNFNITIARELMDTPPEQLDSKKDRQCLELIQTISTIPEAFPVSMNTCGRIAMHPSGRWVLASNRGHDSIAIFQTHSSQHFMLSASSLFHTRGETPRHYQFDKSGEFLFVANQDTDNVSVFRFNQATGTAEFTSHSYKVKSPNFVQVITPNVSGQYFDMSRL